MNYIFTKMQLKYQSDISRDHGWKPFGELGFEIASQIAIDDDWSALRFRHIDFIKKMLRNQKRVLTSIR